jgi:hypothetical protein
MNIQHPALNIQHPTSNTQRPTPDLELREQKVGSAIKRFVFFCSTWYRKYGYTSESHEGGPSNGLDFRPGGDRVKRRGRRRRNFTRSPPIRYHAVTIPQPVAVANSKVQRSKRQKPCGQMFKSQRSKRQRNPKGVPRADGAPLTFVI